MTKRDFLTLNDLTHDEHAWIFQRSAELKRKRKDREPVQTLAGRTLVLMFEKASTRTRVSFEAAMAELGGHALTLPVQDSQLTRGEPLADTARVLGSYADALVMRTHADTRLREVAKHARVPVLNGLTDTGHPVQLLADLFTVLEKLGKLAGINVCFVGDCKANTALSWIEASGIFGFSLTLCAPGGFVPEHLPSQVMHVESPLNAVQNADVIVTDVWASMGQEHEAAQRQQLFAGYTVNAALIAAAKPTAMVLHCLPALRDQEITDDVLNGPASAVWDEAENRLHTQKALLELLLGAKDTP